MDKTKVLIAIDDPIIAKKIVHTAESIINKKNSEIVLLNVIETTIAEEGYFYRSPQKFIEHEAEKSDFAYLENYLETKGFDYKGFVYKEGDAAKNIIDTIKNEKFELVVMGSHNKSTIEKFFLGSVSYKVSRQCKSSALVVKPQNDYILTDHKPLKVLFAVDSSDYSEYASNNLAKFIDRDKAEITIFNVTAPIYEILPPDSYAYTDMTKIIEETGLIADGIVRQAAINVAKQRMNVVKKYHISGDAVPTILSEADKNDFDLIVVGSHGRSGFSDWMLGSVSTSIYEQSQIPVLIVKKIG